MSAYAEAVAYLASLEVVRGWDLELGRMRALLGRRGHPERRFAAIHVAGTNGKGSTAAMIEAVLRAAGHRTGLYTSPHLVDFTERVRAGGAAIPPATVVALVGALRAEAEAADIPLTHFEFVTALAFEWFAQIGVEVAVIEVGLGGRLDATNVLDAPLVTAITSIAHDHERFLGDTLAAIAAEKAGIAKPGVPLVLGPRLDPEARAAIEAQAARVDAPVRPAASLACDAGGWTATTTDGPCWSGLTIGLPGDFQRDNAAVALATLAEVAPRFPVSSASVRAGLAAVEWPGRLAIAGRTPLVVLDGAHNPAGAAVLARELPAVLGGRRATLVFAVMADKDWQAMLSVLLPLVGDVVLTAVGRRALDPAQAQPVVARRLPTRVVADPRAAVRGAVAAAGPDGAVVVAGSLFLIGEAYAALGGAGARLFPEWQGWDRFGTGPSA